MIFANEVNDSLRMRQTFGDDFQVILAGTGNADATHVEQPLNERLIELNVTDVVVLHFRSVPRDDAFAIDRAVVGDGQRGLNNVQ